MLLIIHDTASTNPNQTYSPRRTHPPTPQLTTYVTSTTPRYSYDSPTLRYYDDTSNVRSNQLPYSTSDFAFFFFPSPFPLNLPPIPYQLTLEKFSCRSLRYIIQK